MEKKPLVSMISEKYFSALRVKGYSKHSAQQGLTAVTAYCYLDLFSTILNQSSEKNEKMNIRDELLNKNNNNNRQH